ncbi:hypothetical protein Tsubulata_044000 [Turnera subulata]|uniref:Uncharacterized protein n=1 Tax=Turnera subulata TaxID=218843 RepID=A0A9Q0IY54_9ROSI|nr:hypothetical protein Tsubulata_044000 [Turnera subulata]
MSAPVLLSSPLAEDIEPSPQEELEELEHNEYEEHGVAEVEEEEWEEEDYRGEEYDDEEYEYEYGEEEYDDYDEYGDYGEEYQDEEEYGGGRRGTERGVIVDCGWRGIRREDIGGDLRSGGARILASWNPCGRRCLDKYKGPVIKNLKQPGRFVAPNQEYLDRFLNSLSRRLRHRLTPYFKMIQKTMGFEVPSRLPYDLPFQIIRRADELPLFERNSEKDGIMDAVDDCIDDALFWIQLITGDEHKLLGEVERVNTYSFPWGLFYLTFTALNLSTNQSETFQAVADHITSGGGEGSAFTRFIRVKP